MIIKDLNNDEKNIKSIKQVDFDRKNDCIVYKNINVDGELITVGEQEIVETTEKYIEVEVIGKNGGTWTEWYQLEKFEELNPGVEVV